MFTSELVNMLHSSTITKKSVSKAHVKQMLAEFKIHSESTFRNNYNAGHIAGLSQGILLKVQHKELI